MNLSANETIALFLIMIHASTMCLAQPEDMFEWKTPDLLIPERMNQVETAS